MTWRLGHSIAGIVCFCCLAATILGGQRQHKGRNSDLGRLVGQVVDAQESAPIGRAFVLLYAEENQEQRRLNVDAKGRFELELAPGFYDVLAGAVEFLPQCKRIEISSGALSRFEPKLKADFEHLQQLQPH